MSAERRHHRRGNQLPARFIKVIPQLIRPSLFQAAWYTRRATIAAIYTAAGMLHSYSNPYLQHGIQYRWSDARDYGFLELHQLYSPTTANEFLDQLLEGSHALGTALDETGIYGKYIVDAWKGIIKSRGILP